ncbi:alpha-L-rhamnosidase [Ilyonectria sp. MPI-CAGE-AT-0026]|nr:alpha-L-rhamnosidase [Ilyonectria sp. MPI-CAGE-AT-0026]
MALHIDRVQFEHHREAIGIGESKPRISWRFSGADVNDWVQERYELEITRPGVSLPEVYSVNSSESVLVPWPSEPLQSGASASVRVRVTGCAPHDKPSPWSSASSVEAGLLDRSDWTCSLISSAQPVDISLPRQPVLFRRAFSLNQSVSRARLYVTAHGVYEAHINGQRVGDQVLQPGWTSYKHRLSYQTFDVTHLLQEEQNIITAQVAEGWFCGRLGFLGGVRNIWGHQIGLAAILIIETADGTKTVINSDEEWKSSTGSIVTSEIYDGEVCDLSLDPRGWQTPGFDDASWAKVEVNNLPNAALVAPDGPPVRMIETLQAASVFTTPSGKIVVDFAQNIVGWVRIRLSGPKGQTVGLQFTEELEDGEVAIRPLRICKASDTIILSGEDQIWEPKFTFHGFRYVQIDGYCSQAGDFDLASVTAVVVHTDMEQTGWFECSNPLLNQLHKNIRWGMRGNFLSIPTDCPQRDERLGWTGDIHVFGPTANYLYDTSGMLQGWLKDLSAEQIEDHGSVPPFFCPNVFVDDTRYPTAIWGDVLVGLPWDLYTSYADKGILNRQLESMQKWMNEGIPRSHSTGLWEEDSYQFGDWLDPFAPPDDPGNSVTDPQFVANAYLVHVTSLMHKICLVLGLEELAKSYSNSFAKIKVAFQRRYISTEGRVVCDTQTALALAIHFQLFETQTQERTAAARLKHLILRNSRFKIATGFAGTPIIGHALSRVGEAQLFYRMLYHRKAPSWLYQVSMGATTIWERWDSKLPDGSINPGEMTSFNHYALGAVADWMHRGIAGLVPVKPGWQKFLVAPFPGGDLTHATARFMSPYGLIYVKWTVENAKFSLRVQVPPNTVAEVKLPSTDSQKQDVISIGSGTYDFQIESWCIPPPLVGYRDS